MGTGVSTSSRWFNKAIKGLRSFAYAGDGTRPKIGLALSGGFARETTIRELPVSTEIAGVDMRLKPGGIRELH